MFPYVIIYLAVCL